MNTVLHLPTGASAGCRLYRELFLESRGGPLDKGYLLSSREASNSHNLWALVSLSPSRLRLPTPSGWSVVSPILVFYIRFRVRFSFVPLASGLVVIAAIVAKTNIFSMSLSIRLRLRFGNICTLNCAPPWAV